MPAPQLYGRSTSRWLVPFLALAGSGCCSYLEHRLVVLSPPSMTPARYSPFDRPQPALTGPINVGFHGYLRVDDHPQAALFASIENRTERTILIGTESWRLRFAGGDIPVGFSAGGHPIVDRTTEAYLFPHRRVDPEFLARNEEPVRYVDGRRIRVPPGETLTGWLWPGNRIEAGREGLLIGTYWPSEEAERHREIVIPVETLENDFFLEFCAGP